eukprot:g29960.t1
MASLYQLPTSTVRGRRLVDLQSTQGHGVDLQGRGRGGAVNGLSLAATCPTNIVASWPVRPEMLLSSPHNHDAYL